MVSRGSCFFGVSKHYSKVCLIHCDYNKSDYNSWAGKTNGSAEFGNNGRTEMVEATGLEPVTSTLPVLRSSQMS